ncbi:MAG: hypothetical protein RMJ31_02975 [Nitrososphaerota archaeon]|nr:hypothetical protein [Nitrososphaerales archaeon]MCX8191364.1 hypothetical protein [Nitrososphaerales archaeon]MDW8044720.1 hypothetical protein [Nitrososphaerota archaeon]
MSDSKVVETRMNILTRLLGFIFVMVGIIISYATATTPLLEQVSTVFYLISILFIISGGIALIGKLK